MESNNQVEEFNDLKLKFPTSLKKQPQFQNLKSQLFEQLKNLDSRLESQLNLTAELQDYFKKKSELEQEFSKMMDKMFKHFNQTRNRKESISSVSSSVQYSSNSSQMVNNVMIELMNETRKEAKERSVLSEICSQIVTRLGFVSDDLQRVFKQCREVCIEGQEELLKVLHELHASTKSYQNYRVEWKQAEAKLKLVETQKNKIEIQLGDKIDKSKKFKVIDKEVTKRTRKSNDSRFKYLKSKNEYLLCLDAANAAVQKYFVEDISDLIDCMDLGYYSSLSNALKLYIATEEVKKDSLKTNIETLEKILTTLDSRVDKQKFLEANNSNFALPKQFSPTEHSEERSDGELSIESFMREELEQRMYQLERRLLTLRMESNELWKTLETAETSLLDLIALSDNSNQVKDWFVGYSNKDIHNIPSPKMRQDRIETDVFHINKYHDYMLITNRISRLQSKYDHIRSTLGFDLNSSPGKPESSSSQIIKRKRIGQNKFQQQKNNGVRLFGGSIEEYLEVNDHDIPQVIKSCIRVINLFGLQHQGIFRVSGSQVEINNFKDAFERGEDPLELMTDASDINSVASLLKLYLRELREPLFPIVFFDIFMELAQLEGSVFTSRMKELVNKSLPRSVFVVLRYLFHFLKHLSEYSDENMMDPYNLAICFGPTLVPVPEDKDQVQYQNLVNELIKNVILYSHDIFCNDGNNEHYEKYAFKPLEDEPHEDEIPKKIIQDDVFIPLDLPIFNDQCEEMEAIAQYDFKARSQRELSFKKGQTLILFNQVSSDWWKGTKKDEQQLTGLVPDKYILIKIRDEDLMSCSSSSPKTPPTLKKETFVKKPLEIVQRSNEEGAGPSQQAVEETHRVSDTPDLVMDLPTDDELSDLTGAEVFATQNQCTLKKQIVKPQVMAKPKLPFIQQKKDDEEEELP